MATVDTAPLSDFRPQRRNANKHKQRGMGALEASMRQYGYVAPMTAAADGEIIDGSARIETSATVFGDDVLVVEHDGTRPVIMVRTDIATADTPEARAISIAANRIAEMNLDFDAEVLLEEITAGYDATLLWRPDELEELLADLLPKEGVAATDKASIYTQEQIIESAFVWFRANGFPYRNLAPHVSMQEINKLLTTDPDSLINTDTAYHVADTYHPHRFHAAAEDMKPTIYAFENDDLLRRSFRLQLEYGGLIGSEMWGKLLMVSGCQSLSNFRPGFAAYIYRRFAPQGATVLDTSTGYGGRLVGFVGSGLDGFYIGIDPNTDTHNGNLRMASELQFADKIELHNLPAEDVAHEAIAGRCDFAFTSPPYFRKEHYSEDDTQSWKRYPTGDAWRDGFLVPMMELQFAALKPGSFAVVNIADVKIKNKVYPLCEWTIDAGTKAGFEFVRKEEFPLTRRFGAGMDDEVATEPVLVFRKHLG